MKLQFFHQLVKVLKIVINVEWRHLICAEIKCNYLFTKNIPERLSAQSLSIQTPVEEYTAETIQTQNGIISNMLLYSVSLDFVGHWITARTRAGVSLVDLGILPHDDFRLILTQSGTMNLLPPQRTVDECT